MSTTNSAFQVESLSKFDIGKLCFKEVS
jgi:hypothetical protein